MLFFDPRVTLRPQPLTHNPFPALVAPRPIAWISSISAAGKTNLAPYSHFNIVAADPPMVMFAPSAKNGAGAPKDTLRNVREVPEFVINLVDWKQREAMNLTSKALDHGVSEFDIAGVEQVPSINVRPPRAAGSRAALECKVWQIIELPVSATRRQCHIVIGEVVGIHIALDVIVDGRVSAERLEQIARLGYFDYSTVHETFQMERPD